MKNKTCFALCAITAALCFCACSSETTSTSTSTMSVSVTDEEGNTTTNTTTTENGQTTTSTTTTNADGEEITSNIEQIDPTGLRERWPELFNYGAEGTNADGEHFYFAYDDPENMKMAALMILNDDFSNLEYYDFGEVKYDGDYYTIIDVDGEEEIPFGVEDTGADDSFWMTFNDGDRAEMVLVDKDVIIDDMVSIIENVDWDE